MRGGISNLKQYCGEEEGDLYGATDDERKNSTEYKTVYKPSTTLNAQETSLNNYCLTMYNKGEAIYETSLLISTNSSWGNQYSQIPYTSSVIFGRGGSGLFDFGANTGVKTSEPKSFRTVLVCE